jgi:hypothetical protein
MNPMAILIMGSGLGIIAAAMVSLGLIERQGNRYQNGVVATAS